MLILTRKQGESFFLGEDIEISITEINGDKVRIAIDAPRDIKILRKELKDASETNIEAATSDTSAQRLLNINYFAQKLKEKK